MSKGAVIAVLAWIALAVWVARQTIEDALWRRDERRAEAYLATVIPPPPPEEAQDWESPEPCDCDLCTKKVSFQEWVENLSCELLGLESTRWDIEQLDDYWAEDWETAA